MKMTEFTFYIILTIIVLSMIIFINFKPWWKYMNLAIFVAYISYSLYEIYSDPIYNGFAPTLLTIILMLIHLGILAISIIFFYKTFLLEKVWR